MTFFKEGDNPQPRTPAVQVYAFTFGFDLANGQGTPCTAQGQKAEYVFNDTVKGVDTNPNGFGVGVMSLTHSGGVGVPVLAGGAIAQGEEIVVGMANFTNNDGVVVSLPVALGVSDAAPGDYVVGRATMGSTTTAADTDINAPSIAILTVSEPYRVVGGSEAAAMDVHTVDVELPLLANGDITTWTPGVAGRIISHKFRVTEPVTTAAKAATINLEIDGVDVTGGVIALTSANATPAGAVVNGTAVTALNLFDADSVITWEASGVTTFIEGSGELILTVQYAAE